ncbi:hypothetical protein P7K49_023210 [Saguinus oedipus]|uniref:Uncharacterized protein n=1 Tax=Saguinus oedipus TaxID=9490 RepID=A0ABQ9UL19_SAGOE|nr:hypothetical protein P7K49_023210 [Saguinus oedipus]
MKSVEIRTEAGPRLHIEPPVDYSEDFELCGNVTVQAHNTSEDRPQVGMALALSSGHLKDAEAQAAFVYLRAPAADAVVPPQRQSRAPACWFCEMRRTLIGDGNAVREIE